MSDSYGPIRVYEPSYTYNWWCQCVCEYVMETEATCTLSVHPHYNHILQWTLPGSLLPFYQLRVLGTELRNTTLTL